MKRGHLANSKGFTIVELLIVVVVIAILAAITIVSYNGIQKSAVASAVKAELSSNGKLLEMYGTEKGQFPAPPVASIGLSVSPSNYNLTRNNIYYCVNTATNQFILSALPKGEDTAGYAYVSGQGIVDMPSVYQAQTCNRIGIANADINLTIAPYGFTKGVTTDTWQSWLKH